MNKKSKLMRVGAFLMVLALGTSCFVGGTLAKYTTSGAGEDSARVAKFGVKVEASTGSAFSASYPTKSSGLTDASGAALTIAVQSSTTDGATTTTGTDKVIAPGTGGTMIGTTISGTPEVAVEVAYTMDLNLGCTTSDGTESGNWYITYGESTVFYCPIIFTVTMGGKATEIYGTSYKTAAALEKAVEDKVAEAKAYYKANTDLSEINAAPTITWEWLYENDTVESSTEGAIPTTPSADTEKKTAIATHDAKDTALGDAAATGNAATIKATFTATVTQVEPTTTASN